MSYTAVTAGADFPGGAPQPSRVSIRRTHIRRVYRLSLFRLRSDQRTRRSTITPMSWLPTTTHSLSLVTCAPPIGSG